MYILLICTYLLYVHLENSSNKKVILKENFENWVCGEAHSPDKIFNFFCKKQHLFSLKLMLNELFNIGSKNIDVIKAHSTLVLTNIFTSVF